MHHLFAYGSLMCPEIMRLISGLELSGQPVTLHGYRRCRVRGEPYPAVVAEDGTTLSGLLYRDLSADAWKRLDRFEGDMYERVEIAVLTEQGTAERAGLYLATPALRELLIPEDWSFEEFLRTGRQRFEQDYRDFDTR